MVWELLSCCKRGLVIRKTKIGEESWNWKSWEGKGLREKEANELINLYVMEPLEKHKKTELKSLSGHMEVARTGILGEDTNAVWIPVVVTCHQHVSEGGCFPESLAH